MIKRMLSSKVIRNSGWIIGGKVAQMVIGFLVGIFTARYLGPSNYGVLNTAQAYTAFILPICTLGLSAVFVKCIIDNPGKDGTFLWTGIVFRSVASIAMMLLMLGIVVLLNPEDRTLHIVFFIHSFILLFQSFDLFDYWYQSRYESKFPALFGTIGYLAAAVYKVYLLISGKSVEWFAFATVLDYAIVAIIYMAYSVPKNRIRLKYSFDLGMKMINNSKHFIVSNMLVVIYAQMDKIMIGKMMSNADVGLYSVGVAICGLWTFVLVAVINSVRPNIVETFKVNKTLYKQKLVALYSVIIWMSFAVSVMICIFSKFIITVLYGQDYIGAAPALRIVTWYISFSYLGVARNIWTVCEDKQKYEKIFALAGAVSNFTLNLILIPLLGINGAAIASVSTQIITNFLVPYAIKDTRENSLHIIRAFNVKNLFVLFK